MADLPDPALESVLRVTLRAQADAVPFRIRAADVRATAATRARSRRRSVQLAVVAALVLVAVGGLAFVSAFRVIDGVGSNPSGGAGLSLIPTYERLREVSVGGTELGRAEGAGNGSRTLAVQRVGGVRPGQIVFACSGPDLTFAAGANGRRADMGAFPCGDGVFTIPIGGALLEGALADEVVVRSAAGSSWRAIVVGLPIVAELAAGSDAIAGLPTFEELAATIGSGGPEIARGSGAATGSEQVHRIAGLAGLSAIEFAIACSGGPLTLSWATGDGWAAELGGTQMPCDGTALMVGAPLTGPLADVSQLHVRAPAGTAWVALVNDVSSRGAPSPVP